MKYELVLQGGKTLIITQEEKEMIDAELKSGNSVLTIGKNEFKASMVKGIFEIKEAKDNREKWMQDNREWSDLCRRMSRDTPENKTERELNIRIGRGLKLAGVILTEPELAVMKSQILDFFKTNPVYPRCPMSVWWPFIRQEVKNRPALSKWWEHVARNDEAVAEWLKYQKK